MRTLTALAWLLGTELLVFGGALLAEALGGRTVAIGVFCIAQGCALLALGGYIPLLKQVLNGILVCHPSEWSRPTDSDSAHGYSLEDLVALIVGLRQPAEKGPKS